MIKRAVLWVLLCAGLTYGQNFSGSWSAKIALLPPPVSLESTTLTLEGKLLGWRLGGTAEFFGADGWVWQTFTAQGALGPAQMEWTFLFGPLAPAFLYTYGKAGFALGALELSLHSAYVGPNAPPYVFTGGPSGGMVIEASQKLNGVRLALELGIGARKQDITILYTGVGTYTKVFPVDPFPGGLEFTYLKLLVEKVPICCGITVDGAFAFTKIKGFDYLKFSNIEVPICCGVSFVVKEIKFATDAKTVDVGFKLAPIALDACLTVYAEPFWRDRYWEGIAVHGWKIRCAIAECNYVEFLTALNPDGVERILRNPDLFKDDERQYLKLGFCGPGCCGGQWTLEVGLYFRPTGLFGLSRVVLDATVPVMVNLTVNFGLSAVVGAPAGLTVGWTFTF